MFKIPTMKLSRPVSVVLLALVASSASARTFAPAVGKVLPDFTLPRIDNGEPVSLSDYRGRKVLLIMFASW